MKKQTLLLLNFAFCILPFAFAQQSGRVNLKANPHTFDYVKAIPLDPDDVYWDNQFGATALSGNGDLPVYASVVDGNNLYLAGDFLYAGNLVVNHIVKWDGTHWSALGSGMNDRVTAIA